jgi:uncharacterized membrane protein YdfJ with MMPL/SSD domain
MPGVHSVVQAKLSSGFDRWGRFVTRHPLSVCTAGLIFCLAFCSGLLFITPEARSY